MQKGTILLEAVYIFMISFLLSKVSRFFDARPRAASIKGSVEQLLRK